MSPSTGWVGRGVGVLGDFLCFGRFFLYKKNSMQQNGNEVFGCDVYVIYLIIPGTQMTIVLIGKGLVLDG